MHMTMDFFGAQNIDLRSLDLLCRALCTIKSSDGANPYFAPKIYMHAISVCLCSLHDTNLTLCTACIHVVYQSAGFHIVYNTVGAKKSLHSPFPTTERLRP